MNTDLHDRLRALGDYAISEPPPVDRIAGRGRQIRRRRRALTASLVVLLVVGTVAGITAALDRGNSRDGITSSHKELGRELRYSSGYVVPHDTSDSSFMRAQQALEDSAVVEQYVIMPPGWASVHLATDRCRLTSCGPSPRDRLRLACAALNTGSFAVQLARTPSAATQLRDALGGDATLYVTDDLGDVEIDMSIDATAAQTTRLRTLIARDHDIASYQFIDREAMYREFKNLDRGDSASPLPAVTAGDMYEAFRLYLRPTVSIATVEQRYQYPFPGVHGAVPMGQGSPDALNDSYLRWLRGAPQPSGISPPTRPLPFGDPSVNPCDRSR